ncbi:unnamed protein product [Rotaria sp. Silwood2]|nr:unnamed protein product [Rotaria sp. Silwood2]
MIDLNIQEKANLLSSLMFHISSLYLMVNKCQFNEYHHALRHELESSLLYLNLCQSSLISSFTSTLPVSKDRFIYRLTILHLSVDFVRSLFHKWGDTASVALFTPILINLGRLPHGDTLPAGNYALLRIEENFVGTAIASILTVTIFPVFAIDLLKENIQKSFESCKDSINSMHKVYDELFHHRHYEKRDFN